MRTYNTIEEMNAVAKEQWRGYFLAKSAGEGWSDEQLWAMAGLTITACDEGNLDWVNPNGDLWCTMEMESWARDTTDGIEDEIKILDRITQPPKPNYGLMMNRLGEEFNLKQVSMWMIESIPETWSEMQRAMMGDMPDDGYTDKQEELFTLAFWQAIYKANVK
jgi:hypothetical protein